MYTSVYYALYSYRRRRLTGILCSLEQFVVFSVLLLLHVYLFWVILLLYIYHYASNGAQSVTMQKLRLYV